MTDTDDRRIETGGLTRRGMIAGGLALAAAAVTGVLAPETALASDGDAIQVGNSYFGTSGTSLANTSDGTSGGTPFTQVTLGSNWAGVNAGVASDAPIASFAIRAQTSAAGSNAIYATNNVAEGVAVYVEATGAGTGVDSTSGVDGVAVKGRLTGAGTAVYGVAGPKGCGVRAEAPTADGGVALEVVGAAHFSRSGRGYVHTGKSSVNVTVPGGLATSALVLVTLQTAGSGVYLKYARRVSATTFTVKLNKSAPSKTYFAWLIVG